MQTYTHKKTVFFNRPTCVCSIFFLHLFTILDTKGDIFHFEALYIFLKFNHILKWLTFHILDMINDNK